MRKRVLAMVLAGGKGERLMPLTRFRSKPSVPFGGTYRIIDFVLSNLVNSGVKSIYVLTQFKSQSLTEHLNLAWAGTNLRPGNFVIPVPAQMQTPGEVWYVGTADAICQNLNLVRETEPDLVCVFGGDHIYLMDITQMLRAHIHRRADVTVAAIPVPAEEAPRFGVMEVDPGWRVVGFHEKAPAPPRIPRDPERCLASMGNYVFNRQVLDEMLMRDAADRSSSHDFGRNILPRMVSEGRPVFAYDFETNLIPGWAEGAKNTYWRDVGTLEAYYDANMDLKEVVPKLDLYNRDWPINSVGATTGPAKFVHDTEGRVGAARNSIVAGGTIISGGQVRDCVIGRNVRIHSYSKVEECIVMDSVVIERNCKIRRAIIDKEVTVPAGTEIGYDANADRDRGWLVSETGITVIAKTPKVRPITTMDL